MFSAANLVRIRKERKFSQEEVARRSGLATVTISKLEEGKSNDPIKTQDARSKLHRLYPFDSKVD